MKEKNMLTLLDLANDSYIEQASPENAKIIYSSRLRRKKMISGGIFASAMLFLGILIALMPHTKDPGGITNTSINNTEENDFISIKVENPNANYSIIQKSNNYYIMMSAESMVITPPDNFDQNHQTVSPFLNFDSVKDMKDKILGGHLTEEEEKIVARFPKDENGYVYFLDLNNLYDPILPYGTYVSNVKWTGGDYRVSIHSDICSVGTFQSLTQTEFLKKLKEGYTDLMPNNNDHTCVGSDKTTIGGTEATVAYHRPNKNTLTKTVLYEVKLGETTLMVAQTYALESSSSPTTSETITYSVKVFGNTEGHYFYYYFSQFYKEPSNEWFESLGAINLNNVPDHAGEITVYDFSILYSELYLSKGNMAFEDIVKKADQMGMKKYLTDESSESVYGDIYKTIINEDKKISFKGKEHTVLESFYFCSTKQGILTTVYVTKDNILVDLGKYGIYTWSEHSEIFARFMEYGKPISAEPPYYFEYFKDIFPFVDLEDQSENTGKEADINNGDDLKKLESELLDGFKKNYTAGSLQGASTIIAYRGLFDSTEKDIYSTIESAVRNGNFSFIVHDENDGFKVNSAYKSSEQIFDRIYLLPNIKYFEVHKNTFVLDGKEYKIENKVYFHDTAYGFICIFITDEGVFAATYDPETDKSKIHSFEDLGKLKECYENYKRNYSVYHYSFCTFITLHHDDLSEDDHKYIEGTHSLNDSFDIGNDYTKMDLGFSRDVILFAAWYGDLDTFFAQKATVSDIFRYTENNLVMKYYVSEALKTLYEAEILADGQNVINQITETEKERFFRTYYYSRNRQILFKELTWIENCFYFIHEPSHSLMVYLKTDKGDYVLYTPNLATKTADHPIYLIPLEDLHEIAWKKSLSALSLRETDECGNGAYSEYGDLSKFIIDKEKKEYSFPSENPSTLPVTPPSTTPTAPPQTNKIPTVDIPKAQDSLMDITTLLILIGAAVIVIIIITTIVITVKKRKNKSERKEKHMNENIFAENASANIEQNTEINVLAISSALKKQKRRTWFFAIIALILALTIATLYLISYFDKKQEEIDADYSEIITKLKAYDETMENKRLENTFNDALVKYVDTITRLGYIEVPDKQRAEIDSHDIMRTSEDYIFYISNVSRKDSDTPNLLKVYTKDGENSKEIRSYNITTKYESTLDAAVDGIYLSKDYKTATIMLTYYSNRSSYSNFTELISLDISDPYNIKEKNRITLHASDGSAYMVYGKLIVLAKYYANTQRINDLSSVIPAIDVGNGFEYIPSSKIISPEVITSKNYIIILKIDEDDLKLEDSLAFLSCHNGEDFYVSENNVYLENFYFKNLDTGEIGPAEWFGVEKTKTIAATSVSRISISGRKLKYKGNVELEGYFNNQYNMSEKDGTLRAFTTTLEVVKERSKTSGNLYCIDLKKMNIASKTENFIEESAYIRSVRFDGDSAYVFTTLEKALFDPVLAFDLSDTDNITYKKTSDIEAYSAALIDFGDDLYIALNCSIYNNELNVEVYKKTDGKPELVSEFSFGHVSHYLNSDIFFIDKDKKLFGIEIQNREENYDTKYPLLHFDGNEIRILSEHSISSSEYYYSGLVRGFYLDGYLYILYPSDTSLVVKKIDIA